MRKRHTKGYAEGIGCDKYHSGNTGYMYDSKGFWNCMGCGEYVAHSVIAERQRRGLGYVWCEV